MFLVNFQEIFQGQKYKMSVEDEGFVHKLTISNPSLADMGKYTCEVNGIVTEAFLEVEGKHWKTLKTHSKLEAHKLNQSFIRDKTWFNLSLMEKETSFVISFVLFMKYFLKLHFTCLLKPLNFWTWTMKAIIGKSWYFEEWMTCVLCLSLYCNL